MSYCCNYNSFLREKFLIKKFKRVIGDDLDWEQVRKDISYVSRWKGSKVGGWEGIWRQSCVRKNRGI